MTHEIKRVGFVQAMRGKELLVNTESDELISIVVEDHDLRWKLYCSKVEITVSIIE